jgi:flagellar biosynthesis protein FliQ
MLTQLAPLAIIIISVLLATLVVGLLISFLHPHK